MAMMQRRSRHGPGHGLLSLGVVLALGGCRQSTPERSYQVESGIASMIDIQTGTVSMTWTHRRTGEPMLLTGKITQETEIFINGISASVEDVQPGDAVEVTAWQDPGGVWIVTRVNIERPESFMVTRMRGLQQQGDSTNGN
jgi:hypothetical protein